MLIKVKTHPNSSRQEIKTLDFQNLEIWLHAQAQENKANEKIRELLAKHFKIAKSLINLKHGANAKQKTFEILFPEK